MVTPVKSSTVDGNADECGSDEQERPHDITEAKSTIGFWCQRSPAEEAACGDNQKRQRNEISRLLNVPEVSKADKSRGENHMCLLDHARNIARDRCVDLTRSEDSFIRSVQECMAADMCAIQLNVRNCEFTNYWQLVLLGSLWLQTVRLTACVIQGSWVASGPPNPAGLRPPKLKPFAFSKRSLTDR